MNTDTMVNSSRMMFEQVIIRQFTTEIQLRPCFTLFFILEGQMTVQIYDRQISLTTNDILFIKPFEVHSLIETSDDIKVLAFFTNQEFLDLYCPELKDIYFTEHVIRETLDNEIHEKICMHIANIIYHTLKKEPGANLKNISDHTAILSLIISTYGVRQLDKNDSNDYILTRIRMILDYLNNHYSEKISLGSLADYLNIHPQYLSAFFKKHFRMNFVDYLNNLRTTKALNMLAATDKSITDIALDCGFSNYKTFTAAFKKINEVTPSEYRKTLTTHANKKSNSEIQNHSKAYYSYFLRFWQKDVNIKNNQRKFQNHMSLRFSLNQPLRNIKKNTQQHFYSAGHMSLLMRQDIRNQIISAKKDLHIEGLRIRNIFSDDLYVYDEDENKKPILCWQYIDNIFDFLLSNGIKPFPEIGYVPGALASKKQFIGWRNHPNVSFPKSLKKWSILITGFIRHLIDRYGIREVRSWHFDFWTAPNLQVNEGYWQESKENFFLLYRVTYISIKNADEEIQFGTPNFSLPSGIDWYEDFFDYCSKYDLYPSYVSTHLYSCNDNYDFGHNTFVASLNADMTMLKYEKDTMIYMVRLLKSIMKKHNSDHLPLVASDWNNTYFSRDLTRDTCFMAPYIIYNTLQTMGEVDLMSFHSLSDIHEVFSPNGKLFNGGPGLMDINGCKKASYYAFTMLDKLGPDIIEKGDNYILTRSERGYQLLLFNYVYYDSLYTANQTSLLTYDQRYNIYEHVEDLMIHLFMELTPGNYTIKRSDLNRESGSIYDLWQKIGVPQTPDMTIIEYMNNRCLPDITYSRQEIEQALMLDISIPAHGVVLLEIERILSDQT
ncbi:MAG: helix-turn-helix domain-containing protein [Clostridiales bacterium]|nr:helix-turn-helix domain-containing protein [Clostridiales bacterium]MDY3745804.1 helix-turn-helix domain-containing protein [Lachnospiraceae bacterium]